MRKAIAVLVAFLLTPVFSEGADLCSGVTVTTQASHPRSVLAKPALNVPYTDPEFGTRMIRISEVAAGVQDPSIKPLYSPVAAWNADESYLLLMNLHRYYELRDGHTYAFIRALTTIVPGVPETVYWDPVDPNIIYFPAAGRVLYRVDVRTNTRVVQKDFNSLCGANYMYSEPHAGLPPSKRLGLMCGNLRFVYDINTDTIFGPITRTVVSKPFVSNNGQYVFDCEAAQYEYNYCRVYDMNWVLQRKIDSVEMGHFDVGEKADGTQTWYSVAYDTGPNGSPRGTLITHDLDHGAVWTTGTQVIGEAGGWPYPPSGTHISARAVNNPGWVWMSIIGGCGSTTYCPAVEGIGTAYEGLNNPVPPLGQDLLDNEIVVVDTNTGNYCRVAHHHSDGKFNTVFAVPYWTEPHVTASPSGTRAVFGSDWGNGSGTGSSVDTYVIELPSYQGATPPTITTTSPLPNGNENQAYSKQFAASGGTGPYTWAKSSGTYCTGVSISASGLLSGTPTVPETCTFSITTTDSLLETDTKAFNLTIEGTPVSIITGSIPGGSVGTSYQAILIAQDGTPPYVWDVSAGTICDGVTLSADGIVSGTPTTIQTCNFTARVTDADLDVDTQALSILVSATPIAVSLQANPGSTSAVFSISAQGLKADSTCTVDIRGSLTDIEPIQTLTSTSGAATRFLGGLSFTAGTNYWATANCGGIPDPEPLSFTTLSATTGAQTIPIQFGAPPSILTGANNLLVDYGTTPSVSDGTVGSSCGSGCSVNLSLTKGLYYWRHRWRAEAVTIATSPVQPLPVP